LKHKKIKTDFVTLHVGAGTFKPVKSETIETHPMHGEWIDVSVSTIRNIVHSIKSRIITVGTTSLRTLESLYWMGTKCLIHPTIGTHEIEIKQWEVYEPPLAKQAIEPVVALEGLLLWMEKNVIERLLVKTEILIVPGYRFKIVEGLITNFHQPSSTLLLLVAAAMGEEWKKIYRYALENDFRFLSYGDGSLLNFPEQVRTDK
jgi:S-adenosylmethionine:tRNA ribosyltransferase-isomerase